MTTPRVMCWHCFGDMRCNCVACFDSQKRTYICTVCKGVGTVEWDTTKEKFVAALTKKG